MSLEGTTPLSTRHGCRSWRNCSCLRSGREMLIKDFAKACPVSSNALVHAANGGASRGRRPHESSDSPRPCAVFGLVCQTRPTAASCNTADHYLSDDFSSEEEFIPFFSLLRSRVLDVVRTISMLAPDDVSHGVCETCGKCGCTSALQSAMWFRSGTATVQATGSQFCALSVRFICCGGTKPVDGYSALQQRPGSQWVCDASVRIA